MSQQKWRPEQALGSAIAELDKQALCELVIAVCRAVSDEVGINGCRGGIFPENIARGEDGGIVLGPAAGSGWEGQELQFVAPERYWNGESRPESDVYSLGLLLWYGLSGGRLPLEGKSPMAQISRMNGENLSAPPGCSEHLREIVEKALRFRTAERYANPRALAVMLESCLDNKYLDAGEGAALFKKEEGELNDAERMLLDILDGGREAKSGVEVPKAPLLELPPILSPEEAARLILSQNAPKKPAATDKKAELRELVEEVFGEPETEEKEEPKLTPSAEEPKPTPAPEEPKPAPAEEEAEDVRVYEPGKEKRAAEKKEGIPILTVEEHPELAPVVPKKPAVRYSPSEARSREIAEEVKIRRTRPIGVVLVLCGLLIIAAMIVNHFLQDYEWDDEGEGRNVAMPEVADNAISTEGGFMSAEELEQEQQEQEAAMRQSYYQVFAGDISWTNAKNAANDRGGMLAVINSADEFTMVTQLAQQSGMQGVWIGCHREGSYLIWETQEPTAMMTWADGEPSYLDSRDGAAEDFVMLWNTGSGWAYIDCRNDPVAADPNIYSGRIGYLCEFTN